MLIKAGLPQEPKRQEEIKYLAKAFHMAYMHVYRSATWSLQSLV